MKRFRLALVLIAPLVVPILSQACTGITIRAKDGSILFARTLEFAQNLNSDVIVVPRGFESVGSTPDGTPGLRWRNKYGCVGMNAFGLPLFCDGMNERGLHVGMFYFPGFAKYQAITRADHDRTLAPHELAGFLLGICANVGEAVEAARSVRVADVVLREFGFTPPLHYILTDASNHSIVIEYIDGQLQVHENPLGVMSNSPSFDWHMTNLSNYVNLTVTNVPMLKVGGAELKGLGQGSGMLGLPGDFTPPSRFVRAVAFSKNALPVATGREGVLQAFHILNQFDIPKGAARGLEHGREVADDTLWTTAADLKALRYYFRTFEDSRIRMVDLKAADLDSHGLKTISIAGEERIEDVTPTAR
ncbi:MAG: linear amide C-N hydrolase [Isosphaeraceae bacterium]